MLAFYVFGIGVFALSLLVAYGKSLHKRKKVIYQIALIIILMVIWLAMVLIKVYMFKSGLTIDKLTVKNVAAIELLINTVYPFIIAPLIAIFYSIFKVVE